MSISDEAVEAAAKVFNAKTFEVEWEVLPDWAQDSRREDAKAILEAAAPYMLREAKADAWDEGSRARWDYQWSDDIEPLTNPYRSHA